MKNLLILFFITISTTLIGQNYAKSDNTFLNMNYSAVTEVVNKLDSYEPSTTREKEQWEDRKDQLRSLITQHMVQFVYSEMESSKGIKLNPKDALRDYMTYDNQGLPLFISAKSAVKKVIKKGHESDYYYNFSLNTSVNTLMKGLPGQLKPHITFSIKVFNSKSEVVAKIEEKIKVKDAIRLRDFPKSKFDKLDEYYISLLSDKLKPHIEETAKLAISKL